MEQIAENIELPTNNDESNKNIFKCIICYKKYPTSNGLKYHIQSIHEEEQQHRCNVCSAKFAMKDILRVHLETVHEEERKFQCSLCTSTFKSKAYLKRHTLVHDNKKPFECSICNGKFTTKRYLETHCQVVHAEIKPAYKCPICEIELEMDVRVSFLAK